MADLKQELASLRLQPEEAPTGRRTWPWILLVLIVLGGAVVFYRMRVAPALAAVTVETVKATVATPQQVSAGTPVLTASGYVVARRKAVVSSKIQGRLAWLKGEEGTRVQEHEVIARLEDPDFRASVERSRASIQNAEAAVTRARADEAEARRQFRIADSLAAQNVGSRDAADAARSRVNLAQASLAQAEAALNQSKADLAFNQAQLENTYIRAPFTGVVVKKMAEVGESVAPIPPGVNISTSSGAIVALADLDTLEAEVDVAESNVAQLGSAQPAQVSVEAIPDKTFRAVLRQVIPTADRTKATVQVKVTILDKDPNLKPEMSARVTFLERRKSGEQPAAAAGAPPEVSIPTTAIATRGGKSVVFEVRDGKAVAHEIKPAGEYRGQTMIKQGLDGSEVLVQNPPDGLKDGDLVRVKG
jgi:RND family efflux transporter MFP subunit